MEASEQQKWNVRKTVYISYGQVLKSAEKYSLGRTGMIDRNLSMGTLAFL